MFVLRMVCIYYGWYDCTTDGANVIWTIHLCQRMFVAGPFFFVEMKVADLLLLNNEHLWLLFLIEMKG